MRSPEQILKESKTIAVVGLSDKPERDSHRVARYLQAEGYRIIPVNPLLKHVLGETCYPDLTSIPVPVDLVDVFRRSEEALPVAEQAVAIKAKALWLQDGVINEQASATAKRAGLDVVMDDCSMRVHRRMQAREEHA